MLQYESTKTVFWFICGIISLIFTVMGLASFLIVSIIVWLIGHDEIEQYHLSELDSSNMRFVLWDALIFFTALIISSTFAFHVYLMSLSRNVELKFYMSRDRRGLQLLNLMVAV